MFRWKVGLALAALATVVLVAPRPAAAQEQILPSALTIAVDELGNSRGLPSGGYMAFDPFTQSPSLTYNLPFGFVVPGTVVLTEGGTSEGPPSDVIFFEPPITTQQNTLRFISDHIIEGADAPADTGLLVPTALGGITSIPEVGSEGLNGAIYTPGPNDPGFVPGATVTYDFVSDGVVPEPTSLALLMTGGLPMLGFLRRRRA